MRTALVSPIWLNEKTYYDRCVKWAQYHIPIAKEMSWELALVDNGSSPDNLAAYFGNIPEIKFDYVRFGTELRRASLLDYPHAWRTLQFVSGPLLEFWGYDRVIFVENDFYVMSRRLAEWAAVATGYVPLWTPKYGLPESGMFVVTRGYEPKFDVPWYLRRDVVLEHAVPWTGVEQNFQGDRYEDGSQLPTDIDYAAQVQVHVEVSPWV